MKLKKIAGVCVQRTGKAALAGSCRKTTRRRLSYGGQAIHSIRRTTQAGERQVTDLNIKSLQKNFSEGFNFSARSHLFVLVPRDRIELPTRGFSVNHLGFPNLLNSLKLLKSLNPNFQNYFNFCRF